MECPPATRTPRTVRIRHTLAFLQHHSLRLTYSSHTPTFYSLRIAHHSTSLTITSHSYVLPRAFFYITLPMYHSYTYSSTHCFIAALPRAFFYITTSSTHTPILSKYCLIAVLPRALFFVLNWSPAVQLCWRWSYCCQHHFRRFPGGVF